MAASTGTYAQTMGPGMMGQQMGPGMMPGYSTPMSPQRTGQPSGWVEFAQTCSQCHGLPSPRMHTASQWPEVVARMRYIMSSSGAPIPSQQAFDDITRYLSTEAAQP